MTKRGDLMSDIIKSIHNPTQSELEEFFTGIEFKDQYSHIERVLCATIATDSNGSQVASIVTTDQQNSNYCNTLKCNWRL